MDTHAPDVVEQVVSAVMADVVDVLVPDYVHVCVASQLVLAEQVVSVVVEDAAEMLRLLCVLPVTV